MPFFLQLTLVHSRNAVTVTVMVTVTVAPVCGSCRGRRARRRSRRCRVPASAAVPDYGAFAEEQRAAWNENRRGWPTHDDEQQPPRRKRRRHPRGSRRGHDHSSPPVYQEGRPRSLCGCVFRLVRGAVKLPFFLATTAVCLPASAIGAGALGGSRALDHSNTRVRECLSTGALELLSTVKGCS